MIVHVHLPKTAGSALNRFVLMPNFPAERIFHAYGERKVAQAFRAARAEGRIDLLVGHVHANFAGVHADPDAAFVTILREPVARFVSSINYIFLKRKNPLLSRAPELAAAGDGDALIRALAGGTMSRVRHSNVMTKFIAGQTRRLPLRPGGLGAARRRLESPRWRWGFQHEFDAYAARLEAELGLTRHAEPSTAFVRGDPARPGVRDPKRRAKIVDDVVRVEDLSSNSRRLAEDLNRTDLKLYEWALRRHAAVREV